MDMDIDIHTDSHSHLSSCHNNDKRVIILINISTTHFYQYSPENIDRYR